MGFHATSSDGVRSRSSIRESPLSNPERQIVHLKGQIQLLNALIIQLVEVAPLESTTGSPMVERLLSVQRLLGEHTPARAAFDSAYAAFNLLPPDLAPELVPA